jgi:hypothetical protein
VYDGVYIVEGFAPVKAKSKCTLPFYQYAQFKVTAISIVGIFVYSVTLNRIGGFKFNDRVCSRGLDRQFYRRGRTFY